MLINVEIVAAIAPAKIQATAEAKVSKAEVSSEVSAQKLATESQVAAYRAGIKSVRQIAEEHGVSRSAISKRAKARSWSHELAAKIKAASDAKVSRAAVSAEVSTAKLATCQEQGVPTEAKHRSPKRPD